MQEIANHWLSGVDEEIPSLPWWARGTQIRDIFLKRPTYTKRKAASVAGKSLIMAHELNQVHRRKQAVAHLVRSGALYKYMSLIHKPAVYACLGSSKNYSYHTANNNKLKEKLLWKAQVCIYRTFGTSLPA